MIVTRNVEMRYRGFLGSVMLEVSPGVYIGPRLSKGVRERIWNVLENWFTSLQSGSIVMIWRDTSAPGGLRISSLGETPKDLVEHEGALLVRRAVSGS
ncbi:MAG: type I-E CRISPR-associated endoribonuclease Cas2 [Hyphomicrobiaceae bacterium]|nr:type I-E CRISPR-associated endoribonuclease Cas2 [Hyphomicrobiaceae bacterium]